MRKWRRAILEINDEVFRGGVFVQSTVDDVRRVQIVVTEPSSAKLSRKFTQYFAGEIQKVVIHLLDDSIVVVGRRVNTCCFHYVRSIFSKRGGRQPFSAWVSKNNSKEYSGPFPFRTDGLNFFSCMSRNTNTDSNMNAHGGKRGKHGLIHFFHNINPLYPHRLFVLGHVVVFAVPCRFFGKHTLVGRHR